VNRRPALRVDDTGIHAACCGTNTWTAKKGAPTVFIDGKAAFRMNDMGQSCGGITKLIEGSSNVIIGNDTGAAGSASAGDRNTGSGAGGAGWAIAGATGSEARSTMDTGRPARGGIVGSETSAPPPSFIAPDTATDDSEKQIEIQLVNARGEPQRNVRFELALPDGTVKSGTSAADGYIRISGVRQIGDAKLNLPEIDAITKS
jgi:hypothetical protein